MGLLVLWVLALGLWHPRSGAEVLQWRPTRAPEVELRNELDDVAQMIAAQNALRERHGKARRTQAEVEAQVRHDQQALTSYAADYWASERTRRAAAAGDDDRLVVYEKPACSKCRRLVRLLEERGIDFDRVDFHIDPLPAARIAELLAKAGVSARDALRPGEPASQALLSRDASDEEVLAAMAEHPELLQRPIVERGDRAVLARPAERVLTIL